MADVDRQLVQRIADEVLAALQGRGERASSDPVAAPIHPPLGECTGDYSKFPELRGKGVGAENSHGSAKPQATEEHPVTALKGFVTAEQLRAAIASSKDGVAVLAADARLTPLANDLAREMPAKVRRVGVTAPGRAAAVADASWLWWADGFCPTVQAITNEHRGSLVPLFGDRSATGLSAVVRELSKRVREKRAAGGLLFVKSGARAMCYANRCRSLRAVLGTCEESVEEGIRELGANVLVIEYPHVGAEKMRRLATRFTQSPPAVAPSLERELRELGECG